MSLETDSEIKEGEAPISPWKNDPWGKPQDTITNTKADDFDEVQQAINLAIYGDTRGELPGKTAKKHTIKYKMMDDSVIPAEKAKTFSLASFNVMVNHKEDETVDIIVRIDNRVVTKTSHLLGKIFL